MNKIEYRCDVCDSHLMEWDVIVKHFKYNHITAYTVFNHE